MRKTLAALIGAVATVTMMTGAGVASAATGHPASPHPAVTGTEHFQLVSASLSGKRSPVAAYGVFNASGVQVRISNTRDTFTFPGGGFRLTHKTTRSRSHFSKSACAAVVRVRGTYKISRGTGTYAGISGSGHFRLRLLFVLRHTSHGCSKNPIAVQTIIRARGPVTLP
jgi:hypothetical protein